MAHMNARTWNNLEIQSQAIKSAALGVGEAYDSSDDGLDFPPTAYPVRELLTASIFVAAVIAIIVWGGWKLLLLV